MAVPVVFIAYLVRGICGFGSGLIAIPILSLMFPLKVAVPLIVMLDYLASAGQGVSLRRSIAWAEISRLVLPALIGVSIGLMIFHRVDAVLLTRLLGGFVFLYAIYALWGPKHRSRLVKACASPDFRIKCLSEAHIGSPAAFFSPAVVEMRKIKGNWRMLLPARRQAIRS